MLSFYFIDDYNNFSRLDNNYFTIVSCLPVVSAFLYEIFKWIVCLPSVITNIYEFESTLNTSKLDNTLLSNASSAKLSLLFEIFFSKLFT